MRRTAHALTCLMLGGCFDPASSPGSGTDTDASTGMPTTTAMTQPSTSLTDSTSMSSTTMEESTSETPTSSGESSDGSSTTSSEDSTSSGGIVYAHTIYLNFEGVTLTEAPEDDATNNQVSVPDAATVYEPFGDSPQPAGILPIVQEDFAPFDMLVTDVRPKEGSYAMAVISPTNPFGGGILTIATEVDCGNQTENNIVFIFVDAASGFTNQEIANFISSVLGHSFGLDNGAIGTGDLMENSIVSDDIEFVDACLDLAVPPGVCSDQHIAQCGPTDQQNTHAELLDLLGPSPA